MSQKCCSDMSVQVGDKVCLCEVVYSFTPALEETWDSPAEDIDMEIFDILIEGHSLMHVDTGDGKIVCLVSEEELNRVASEIYGNLEQEMYN